MSRGIGELQKQIINEVYDKGEVQQNLLIWSLARKKGKVLTKSRLGKSISSGTIDRAFYNNIRRSIKSLIYNNHLQKSSRKLQNIDELVEYYPYKTSKLEISTLRIELLPVLKDIINTSAIYKFNMNDVELFLLEKLKEEDREYYLTAQKKWGGIENKIIQLLHSSISSLEKDMLISILIKGRQLFADKRVKFSSSLCKLINTAENSYDSKHLEISDTLKDLVNFYKKFFDQNTINHTWFKVQLYSVADLGLRSNVRLKDETKKELFKKSPELLKSLPGHDEPLVEKDLFRRRDRKFSKYLDKIIDRHAFSKFDFLTPCSNKASR